MHRSVARGLRAPGGPRKGQRLVHVVAPARQCRATLVTRESGEMSYSSQDSNRSRQSQITPSWEPLAASSDGSWRTPVDGPRLATDQKVGGSSPSERARHPLPADSQLRERHEALVDPDGLLDPVERRKLAETRSGPRWPGSPWLAPKPARPARRAVTAMSSRKPPDPERRPVTGAPTEGLNPVSGEVPVLPSPPSGPGSRGVERLG